MRWQGLNVPKPPYPWPLDHQAGLPWPVPTVEAYEFTDEESLPDVAVEVHLAWDDDGAEPFVVAVVVRSLGRLDPKGRSPMLSDGAFHFLEPIPRLSWRRTQRLPVGALSKAALRLAKSRREQHAKVAESGGSLPMFDPEESQRIARELPPGRPRRGKGTDFYGAIAKAHEKYTALGLHPSTEIAREKKVPPGTARQWIHRARKLGLLRQRRTR